MRALHRRWAHAKAIEDLSEQPANWRPASAARIESGIGGIQFGCADSHAFQEKAREEQGKHEEQGVAIIKERVQTTRLDYVTPPCRHTDANRRQQSSKYVPDEAGLDSEFNRWEFSIKKLFPIELHRAQGGRYKQHREAPEDAEVHDSGV